MKAIQIYEHGGPEVLEITDVPMPKAQAGQILVKNREDFIATIEAVGEGFLWV